MSLAFAVRGLCVVEDSHGYSQAWGSLLRAQAFPLQITNAKRKVVIIQDFRSGEVDQKNIEDSCRLFLSKVAVLNTVLPVHSCGGEKGSGQLRFCSGETPSTLESEGASILLATCPSSQRQFIYPFPSTYINMRISSILRFQYDLQATVTRTKRSDWFRVLKDLKIRIPEQLALREGLQVI